MDDFENFKDGIGVMAETIVLFFRAVQQTGATEDEAYSLTQMFIAALISNATNQ